MDDDSRRRRRRPLHLPLAGECGEDRISCLPDELLHVILLRLGSSRAAARTSVLSHRWRRVWAHLPELILSEGEEQAPASSFPDTVDAALAAYAAPTLQHLSISERKHGPGPGVPAHRIAPWLRFASQRVRGVLFLGLRPNLASFRALADPVVVGDETGEELELPACGAATKISLSIDGLWRAWRLRPAGVFTALTELKIEFARMEGRELSDLVSTQCPQLKRLDLFVTLVAVADVSVHSNSLHSMRLVVLYKRRLEIVTPELEVLNIFAFINQEVHISAPKLAVVTWGNVYDPCQHQFISFPRRLGLLRIKLPSAETPLM